VNPEPPVPDNRCPASRAELDVPALFAACCADDAISAIGYCIAESACGGLTSIALTDSNGLGGTTCYYDTATGALVTTKFCTDTRVMCGGTAYCEYMGQDVPPCTNGESRSFKVSACK